KRGRARRGEGRDREGPRDRPVQSRGRIFRARQPLSARRRSAVPGPHRRAGAVRRARPLPAGAPARIPALPLAPLRGPHPPRPILVRSELGSRAGGQGIGRAGATLVKGPYVAETFAVSVEEDYLVIELAG